MFISVLLPEPLVPTIATNSPCSISRSTSRSARTVPRRTRSPSRRVGRRDERVSPWRAQNIFPFFFLSASSISSVTILRAGGKPAGDLGVEAVGDADLDDARLRLLVAELLARERRRRGPLPFASGGSGGCGTRLAVRAHRRRRLVAERGVRDAERALHFARLDRDRRGHAGAELLVGVLDLDDRRVRDDALHVVRAVADLLDLAAGTTRRGTRRRPPRPPCLPSACRRRPRRRRP